MPPQAFGAPTPKIEAPHTDNGKDLPGALESNKNYEVFDFEKSYQLLFDENNIFKKERLKGISSEHHSDIAQKLIEAGEGESVARDLSSFKDINHNEIAQKLIEAGEGESIARNLFSFKDLNNETALKLIEAGEGESVAGNLSFFKDINHNEIAQKLIEAGEVYCVVSNLYSARNLSFKDLNNETALKLIEAGEGKSVAGGHYSFEDLNNETALKLIEAGEGFFVLTHLSSFEDLNNETALKLIEEGYGKSIAKDLSSFKDINHNEIAQKLIEAGEGKSVATYSSSFEDLNNETALKLIEAGEGFFVLSHLSSFKDINHNEIAQKLIEAGEGESVAVYLSSFKDINHNEIAQKLIEAGEGGSVARNLFSFGGGYSVAGYLSSFKDLNNETALKLIEAGYGESVAKHISSFKDINHNEIALKLLEKDDVLSVIDNIAYFTDIDYEKLMINLVEKKKYGFIIKCGSKFGKNLKTVPFFGDIYTMQPPSNNEDSDPWKKHLLPLLNDAFGENDEALENEKAKNAVLKYIKNFGLVYVPYLFDIFWKITDTQEMEEETKKELRTFGINPNLQRDAILLELNKVAKGYTKNILEGDIPESLDTSLGKALFTKEFVPQSSFDRGYNNWKELGFRAKDSYSVPSYIRKQKIELVEKGDMDESDASLLHKKRQDVFENKETVTRFETFKGYIEDVHNGFGVLNVEDAVQKRIESQINLIEKKDKAKDFKVIESIQKAIDKDLLLLKNLEEFTLGKGEERSPANSSQKYARLVELSAERNNKEENLNRLLRTYVLDDIMTTTHGFIDVFNDILAKNTLDANSLRALSDFTSHSIDHEYLDKKELGFSEEVKTRIRTLLMANKVYKISSGKDAGDMSLDYFTKIVKDLEKIDNPTDNKVASNITFVPVGGLGRLTAGNVGDACYTSQTERLTNGDFQNTHMMMITKESKDGAEHIAGSILGIQAQEDETGVAVYVIRANNPQENYLSSIDVDSYAEASVEACIQQAVDIRNQNVENGSRGDIKVCMPMEKSSNAAMTNRPRVHKRMFDKFRSCEKVGLNSNDDTNFNGYDIWNKYSSHAVVCIYEIKDCVEYYYGDHREEKSHDLLGVYHDTEIFVPEWKNKLDQIKKNVLRPR